MIFNGQTWIDNVVSAQGDFGLCHLLLLTVGADLLETRLINSVGSQSGQLVSHGLQIGAHNSSQIFAP